MKRKKLQKLARPCAEIYVFLHRHEPDYEMHCGEVFINSKKYPFFILDLLSEKKKKSLQDGLEKMEKTLGL